jgi:hypothetical protein
MPVPAAPPGPQKPDRVLATGRTEGRGSPEWLRPAAIVFLVLVGLFLASLKLIPLLFHRGPEAADPQQVFVDRDVIVPARSSESEEVYVGTLGLRTLRVVVQPQDGDVRFAWSKLSMGPTPEELQYFRDSARPVARGAKHAEERPSREGSYAWLLVNDSDRPVRVRLRIWMD